MRGFRWPIPLSPIHRPISPPFDLLLPLKRLSESLLPTQSHKREKKSGKSQAVRAPRAHVRRRPVRRRLVLPALDAHPRTAPPAAADDRSVQKLVRRRAHAALTSIELPPYWPTRLPNPVTRISAYRAVFLR
ncbi:hypothetical protein EVAR_76522_1 [Eumeta japonica]|uniref:Uncharacterized protein n=1 Tax=Eumeta variegata TaxID=151549 RepID=A0A4C1T881_EUMVA|nr:hypothetical protein EVAR_76522_1 [Eumeta japonica]